MSIRFVLTDYVNQAMAQAVYDKLEDTTFAGRIPGCKGVIAFAATLRGCEDELRSMLEDWIWLGLRLGHALPVISGIDLNQEPAREPVGTV
jgi:predicted RNase H-like HicB family nuclease